MNIFRVLVLAFIISLSNSAFACFNIPTQNGTLRHYDAQGRLIGKSVRQDNEVKEYDYLGRLQGKKIIRNTEIKSYDAQGRLIGISK